MIIFFENKGNYPVIPINGIRVGYIMYEYRTSTVSAMMRYFVFASMTENQR